jgi:hypothetical protein
MKISSPFQKIQKLIRNITSTNLTTSVDTNAFGVGVLLVTVRNEVLGFLNNKFIQWATLTDVSSGQGRLEITRNSTALAPAALEFPGFIPTTTDFSLISNIGANRANHCAVGLLDAIKATVLLFTDSSSPDFRAGLAAKEDELFVGTWLSSGTIGDGPGMETNLTELKIKDQTGGVGSQDQALVANSGLTEYAYQIGDQSYSGKVGTDFQVTSSAQKVPFSSVRLPSDDGYTWLTISGGNDEFTIENGRLFRVSFDITFTPDTILTGTNVYEVTLQDSASGVLDGLGSRTTLTLTTLEAASVSLSQIFKSTGDGVHTLSVQVQRISGADDASIPANFGHFTIERLS